MPLAKCLLLWVYLPTDVGIRPGEWIHMAKSKLMPLAEGQLEIMEIVWERGEVTVGELWKALSAHRKVARNTVQTMVQRLAEQGWLHAQTDTHSHRYRAAVRREKT